MNVVFGIFRNRRVLLMFLLGFASGLPFNLIGATFSAWLTNLGVDIKAIGLLSLVGLGYSLKLAWAPLIDRYRVPLLGRRRGWLLLFQLGLVAGIGAMGLLGPDRGSHPSSHILLVIIACAVGVGFLAASQDIVSDAYRTDLMRPEERAAGTATYVFGYRVAMLSSGALALILSDHTSWRVVYLIMGGLMFVGVATTLWLAPEPETARPPRRLRDAIVEPLVDFFSRRGAVILLVTILLFGLGDHVARTLTTPFLLRQGFSNSEVGEVTKVFGVIATMVGTLGAGGLVARYGLWRMMLLFATLQPLGAGCYGLLALHGKSHPLLFLAVGVDNVCTGFAVAALDAFLMALCNKRYSATQFALLSSASGIAGRLIGSSAGFIASRFGWSSFFFGTMFVCVPALLLLWSQRRAVEAADRRTVTEAHPATAG